MKAIKTVLTAPVFEDEIKTQQAYLLHIILWVLICVPLPFVIYTLTLAPENTSRALIQTFFAETANIILVLMLHRGFIKAASVIQVGAFWVFFTVTAMTGSGVQSEAYLLGYGLVITIAGMLHGGRGSLVMTVLSLIAGGVMVYSQPKGMIVTGFDTHPLTTWIVSLVLFPVMAALQFLGTRINRRALERARASEARYRLISEVSSDYTFSTILNENGKLDLNWVAGAFESMTGFTFEEYVASGGWQGHLFADDMEGDNIAFNKLTRNEMAISEVRTFKKDGELRWVRVYANPVWDERENRLCGIIGAVQDITKQKQAEEALRKSESIYRKAIEVAGAVPYHQTFDENGKIVYDFMGEGICDITGYEPEEFNDDLWGTLVQERHLLGDLAPLELEQAIEQVRVGNIPIWKCEHRIKARDGQIRWVFEAAVDLRDEKGIAYGSVGLYQDITERKQLEEEEANHREGLEKVITIGKRVTESNHLHPTLQKIWQSIRLELGFDRVGIYLYNPDDNRMDGTFGTNNEGKMIEEWDEYKPLNDNSLESKTFLKVLKDPNGFYFTHHYDTDHDIRTNPVMSGVKDYAAVAAWSGNKPVAVLCVDNAIEQKPITTDQLESLRLFAGFAGLAIENSRLNEVLQNELAEQKQAEENEAKRRAMLEKVILLGQSVTEVKDLKTTIERIWHGVHDAIGFDRLAIFLYDQETNTANGTLGTDDRGNMVEEWEYQRTLDHNKPTSFMRALEQPNGLFYTNNFSVEFNIPEGHGMYQVRDFASVAAWAGDKPVAIITVDNHPSDRSFSPAQLEALRLFGGYAGLAIQNSKLNTALQVELVQRKNFINELENKNAELERFTYTVSHDLKSPLVTITGFLGFLEKDALNGNQERVKNNIDRIAAAARKMQKLLNDLLELSRIGRLMNQPEDILFGEIVHEAIDHLRGRLDQADAIIEIQREFPVVHGDRVRLVEVVQNLIENSVKYINPEIPLKIEIGTSGQQENRCPVFFVRDNGIGIEPEYHEVIFGLFNKLDAQSEGTGIGLSLVKRIIEVHNGRIWVESEKGKGATFYFSLPTPKTKE